MKNLFLTIIIICLFTGTVFCQSEKERNWSVEAGLLNSYFNVEMTILPSNEVLNVNLSNSLFLPSLRINRNINLKDSPFFFQPFVGASIIGANSNIRSIDFQVDSTTYFLSTYGASFYLIYLDVGSFISYSIHNIDFQFGIKGQYLMDYYGLISLDYSPNRVRLRPHPSPDGNQLSYDGKRLTNLAACAVLRMQYNFKRYFFATEFWQGLTDLSLAESDWFENEVYQRNFSVSFGYKF